MKQEINSLEGIKEEIDGCENRFLCFCLLGIVMVFVSEYLSLELALIIIGLGFLEYLDKRYWETKYHLIRLIQQRRR